MDRGAWWAAVYGIAQSRTRLKRLSMHACIGEGNGNPLQCSCLENLRDGGDRWAAIYGVAQSRTRLKRLSSSSTSSQVLELFFNLLKANFKKPNKSNTKVFLESQRKKICPSRYEPAGDFNNQQGLLCLCAWALSRFSPVRLFTTPWSVACQALLSMEFSRQEYWSGLPCPSPEHLLDPEIEPVSPALQEDSLLLSHWEALCFYLPYTSHLNIFSVHTSFVHISLYSIYSWDSMSRNEILLGTG